MCLAKTHSSYRQNKTHQNTIKSSFMFGPQKFKGRIRSEMILVGHVIFPTFPTAVTTNSASKSPVDHELVGDHPLQLYFPLIVIVKIIFIYITQKQKQFDHNTVSHLK